MADARRRLIEAALELIAEKGVDGLRLRELAQRADIGSGSFYTHFESKDELVEALVTETVDRRAAEIAALCDTVEDPAEAVAVAHRSFIRLAYDEPALASLIVQLARGDFLLGTVLAPHGSATFRRGLAAAEHAAMDPALLMTFFVGGTLAVMRAILEDGEIPPSGDIASAQAVLRAVGFSEPRVTAVVSRPFPQPSAEPGSAA